MRKTFETPGPVTVALDIASGDIEVTVVDAPRTEVEVSGYDKDEVPRVLCDPMPDGGYRVSVEHKPKKFWGLRITLGGGLRGHRHARRARVPQRLRRPPVR